MYTPKLNQITDRAVLLEAMRENSFAILFGAGGSRPLATHLPLVVKDEGAHGVLEGHFARANPHWQVLGGSETLVVFAGPHSFVSPALYTESLSVPTWNYVAVHAYGKMELIEEEAAKTALLEGLIALHEPAYLERWNQFPDGFRRTMLAGIVGFRIPVSHVEGKFKLSQNRAEAERRNIFAAQQNGSADERALAAWMKRLGC